MLDRSPRTTRLSCQPDQETFRLVGDRRLALRSTRPGRTRRSEPVRRVGSAKERRYVEVVVAKVEVVVGRCREDLFVACVEPRTLLGSLHDRWTRHGSHHASGLPSAQIRPAITVTLTSSPIASSITLPKMMLASDGRPSQ